MDQSIEPDPKRHPMDEANNGADPANGEDSPDGVECDTTILFTTKHVPGSLLEVLTQFKASAKAIFQASRCLAFASEEDVAFSGFICF